MIQKRIDLLKPYFKGIKVAENYRIAEFNLKRGWVIQVNDDIEFQQQERKEGVNILHNMFYSDTKTFDEILTFVEEEVIAYNLEIEQKETLLREKVEELKRVFEDKSLVELGSLEFTTEDNSLKLGSNKKGKHVAQTELGNDPRSKPKYLKNIDNNKDKSKQNGVTEKFSTDSKSN